MMPLNRVEQLHLVTSEEQMSSKDSVDVIIDGQRYRFTRYELAHMADALLGNTRDGARGWHDVADNHCTGERAAEKDARQLAEAHERLGQAFNDAGRGRERTRGMGR